MSYQQGQQEETIPSYMDGINVKISEKYKPPHRINLAMTYAQRLERNKHIQDNIPHYDFSLENTVTQNMRELRTARKLMVNEKRDRFEKLQKDHKRLMEEKELKDKELQEKKADEEKELFIVNNKASDNTINNLGTNVKYSDWSESQTSEILLPMQSSSASYSRILTPMPLTSINTSQPLTNKQIDKSPFNIKDFEADTSSPFDNMALKTINDMEELAQVLKNDDSNYVNQSYGVRQVYSTYAPVSTASTHSQMYSHYINHESTPTNNAYSPYVPASSTSTVPAYVQPPVGTDYSRTNGYYYSPDDHQTFIPSPCIYKHLSDYSYGKSPPQIDEKTTFRSVPDIMKALEAELSNTHIENNLKDHSNVVETDTVNKSAKQDNPYEFLPKNLQQLSRRISFMGFPLPRVARACQLLGDDEKKIVEHLLVMSELLDLGFPEKEVSNALLQCNNNRDKALDLLIS